MRRQFIKKSGVIMGALMLSQFPFQSQAWDVVDSFGFQAWTIRDRLVENPAQVAAEMAGYGYSEIEMCSPLGYQGSGFGPLHKYTGSELKQLFLNEGLKCTSSHFTFGELREHLEDRITWSKELGLEQMILSSFWLPEDERTPDNYRRVADELNRMAEITRASGLQMGFHNHHMEFETVDGQLIYDVLLDEFDPKLVKMQFQVAVVNVGYHAADYFRKYPGRFISAHLSDWSAAKQEQVPIGQGEVDWPDFFDAAKTADLKNVYVEMDPVTFKPSADYLSAL